MTPTRKPIRCNDAFIAINLLRKNINTNNKIIAGKNGYHTSPIFLNLHPKAQTSSYLVSIGALLNTFKK